MPPRRTSRSRRANRGLSARTKSALFGRDFYGLTAEVLLPAYARRTRLRLLSSLRRNWLSWNCRWVEVRTRSAAFEPEVVVGSPVGRAAGGAMSTPPSRGPGSSGHDSLSGTLRVPMNAKGECPRMLPGQRAGSAPIRSARRPADRATLASSGFEWLRIWWLLSSLGRKDKRGYL